jgi:hypothetical protein
MRQLLNSFPGLSAFSACFGRRSGWSQNLALIRLQGLPPYTAFGSSDLWTTDKGVTIADRPTVTPICITQREEIQDPSSITMGDTRRSIVDSASWEPVVRNVPCEIQTFEPMRT